eukprot:SM000041S15564  [mRNA]  locus=s41:758001:758456:- [translate_table: standard]
MKASPDVKETPDAVAVQGQPDEMDPKSVDAECQPRSGTRPSRFSSRWSSPTSVSKHQSGAPNGILLREASQKG